MLKIIKKNLIGRLLINKIYLSLSFFVLQIILKINNSFRLFEIQRKRIFNTSIQLYPEELTLTKFHF